MLIYFDDKSIIHIKATYLGKDGKKIHGTPLKKELIDKVGKETLEFEKDEYIVKIDGKYSEEAITALSVKTNLGKEYDFETGEGSHSFSIAP